ncbi:MAG: hypothetical protein SGI73_07075 [Chloroflexota bacterium]|nr:hypothetical protein [Chloroflexota bacterium]
MSILGYQAPALRAIAESLRLPLLAQIARQPGVAVAYRITVLYHDGRASNSAATLTRLHAARGESDVLELAYSRAWDGKPIMRTIPRARCDAFARALVALGFDRLPDQPDLPDRSIVDLWLIERAAGTFVRGVIVAPELAHNQHAALVDAVRVGLPEALREVSVS